ncbi:hypothetical protein ACK3TF_003270 [Chlorella vulgaris]
MSGKLQRTLYRNLLRLARNFDAPVLKALICRNHGAPLPPSLDAVVAQFLGSPQAHYYWPGPGERQRRVRDAVRSAFRHPAADAQMEDAFAGMRYLSGLLAVARKHGLTDAAASGPALAAQPASSSGGDGSASASRGTSQQVQAVPVPTQGSVLLAHPCLLGSIFSRSAVLLCRHDPLTGSYGLVLNKPLGTSLKDLHEKMKQLGSSLGDAAPSSSSSSSSSSSTDASPFSSSRDGGGSGSGVLHDRGAAALAPGACGGDSSTSSNVEAEAEAGSDVPAAQSLQAALLEFARAAPNPPSPEYVAAVGAALRALGFTPQQQEAQEGPRDEHDEYGNWIESPYDSDDDAELAGGGEGEGGEHDGLDGSGTDGAEVVWAAVSSDGEETGWHGGYGSSAEEQQDSEEEEEEEEEEAGVSRSQAAVRALEAARSAGSRDIGSLLRDALRGGDQGGEGGDVQLQLTEPDHDPSGVLAAMGEAVRLAGGGTAVLLDSAGHLWTHFLPSTAESSENLQQAGGSQAGQASSSSSSGEAVPAAEDNAAAIASLLLRCLTPDDRQLLATQQQAALQERWQRLHSDEQRQQQPLQKHQTAAQPPPASNSREQLEATPAAACKPSKARRFGAEVQRLLADVAAAFTEPSEPLQGRLQGGGSASSSSSSSSSGSRGTSSLSSSGGDEAPTVGMLMGLFGGSPLFRGGPVPGVLVLHRRPLLGGELVLAPGGSQLSTGSEAAGDEAEAEWGLLVGADLRRAQALLDAGYLSPADVRVCMGDSAWAGGQLQAELDSGTWAVVSTTPEFLDLFGTSAALASDLQANMGGGSIEGGGDASSTSPAQQYEEELWGRCLRSLGGEYAELARVPAGVWADLALLEV